MTAPNNGAPGPDGAVDSQLDSSDCRIEAAKTAAPLRLTFPSHFRIRSGRDFERIYAKKQKASDAVMLIFADANGLGHSRIGLSVSRRHGNSVVRHRLRRLLREAFRLEQHQIPSGMDLILIPGRDSKSATQTQFRDSIVRLARKLAARISSAPADTGGSARPHDSAQS